jgi:hypothetical protein
MAFKRAARVGLGGAALALVATGGIGFVTPQAQQLPTVTVWHNPT